MANHGYVTTRRKLTTDGLAELVEGISRDRFAGALRVSRDGRHVVVEDDLLLWLASGRKVEIRDQIRGEYGRWIDAVVTNDLALALDGTISCQGIEDKWKGKPGLFPTLRNYIDTMRAHARGTRPASRELRELFRYCDELEFDACSNEAMYPYLGR